MSRNSHQAGAGKVAHAENLAHKRRAAAFPGRNPNCGGEARARLVRRRGLGG